jgi:cysteine synthase
VGNTPLLRVSEPLTPADRGFWAKLEGFNPGGIKDRPGLHMVERARARGDLLPGARIIESTSGTLGLGLALAGMVYGHPVTLVTDPGLEMSMTRLLTAYGAQVNVVSLRCPRPARLAASARAGGDRPRGREGGHPLDSVHHRGRSAPPDRPVAGRRG